jgi:hypothetical protein
MTQAPHARDDEADVQAHASALAGALAQDDANRRTVFDWGHPSWLAGTLPRGAEPPAGALAAWAPRWLERLGAGPVPLARLDGRAVALVGLPIGHALRALRLRALWPRRAELRHWIDRARRVRLSGWIGAQAAEALRRDSAGALGCPAWLAQAPALDAMSDDALAWDGYCLFAQDRAWPDTGALPLARLALPRDAAAPAWLAGYRPAGHGDDSAAVLAAVLAYLPLIAEGEA